MELAIDWVQFNAQRRPNAIALECADTGRRWTWAELDARAGRLARALGEHFGLQPGDRVAILSADDIRVVELHLALLRLRVIVVPLNFRLTPRELEAQCRDSGPRLMVYDAAWAEVARQVIDTTEIPQQASWDTEDASVDIDEIAVRSSYGASLPAEPSDICQLLYTSGTTGIPKAAIITRSMMTWNAINVAEALHLTPNSTYLSSLPLFHAAGLNVLLFPTLITGGKVTVTRRFSADRVLSLLESSSDHITHWAALPAMLHMMMDAGGDMRVFPTLQHLQIGAGIVTDEMHDYFAVRGAVLQRAYGATETGPLAVVLAKEQAGVKHGSLGSKVKYVEMRCVDHLGADVGPGEIGEIWLRGPVITPGYWQRDSTDFFRPGGWFATGDLLSIDEDGYLYWAGRLMNTFKSGGETVYVDEVEAVLLTHQDVIDACVIPVSDQKWGEVGMAVVVRRPGSDIGLDELALHCDGLIARYKIPKRVEFVDEIPRNVTGKVVRHALIDRYA